MKNSGHSKIMKKVRIIDVANHVGVSKSTISQYLNGRYTHMSEETKVKIQRAIEELHYTPSAIARSLKTEKTETIGVVVRDISGSDTSRIIRGIEDYCKSSNYNVLIESTDFDKSIEERSLKLLKQMRVDGIIIAASGKNNDMLSKEIESGFPLVQIHLEYDDLQSSLVLSDYRKGAYDATEYLINLGHKRICFFTQEYETYRSRYERFQGYKDALDKYNIPFDINLVQFWDRKNGFSNSIKDILSQPNPPTALFPVHLQITLELLKELNNLNISIPADISVIGFDEIPMVDFFKVPITVVKQAPYEIGSESAKLLMKKITKEHEYHEKMVLPCTLIERESCAPLNN